MGRTFTSLARFNKGLVSDAVPVAGGLLEALNVVPLPSGNGWKVRGGKGTLAVMDDSAGGQSVFTVAALAVGSYQGLLVGAAAAGTGMWPINQAAAGSKLLQALPAGQYTNGLTTRSNEFVPMQGALMGPELWMTSLARIPARWAGANGSVTTYSTGTVATTAGSYTITGSGTTWTTSHIGCYLWIDDASLGNRAYRIVGRSSNTSVTVDRPLPSSSTGKSYAITNVSWWSVKPGTFGGSDKLSVDDPVLTSVTARSYLNAYSVAQHQGRMFAGWTVDQSPLLLFPDRLRWSAVDQETDGAFGGDGEWGGAEYWHPNAYLDVAPGKGGRGIVGLASLGGTLFIFKTGGVFALRGYVETDGRDVGAVVETVTLDTGLVGLPVVLEDVIYFIGRDGIYELTERGLRNLSAETGVQQAFVSFVANGYGELSFVDDRLIHHGALTLGQASMADVANVMVFHRSQRVWSQQQTVRTTRAVQGTGPLGGQALTKSTEGFPGRLTQWSYDTLSTFAHDGNTDVIGKITTHPINLKGQMNGRLRAAQVRARWETDDGATMQLSVLLGEEGTTTAVEAAITGAAATSVTGRVEQWYRLPVRGGTPPVDSVRVRLSMTDRVSALRVYEVGVEHVPVARIR